MSLPSSYKILEIQSICIFEDKLSNEGVEDIFDKLLSIKRFDGVKKVADDKAEGMYAGLTSADSTLRVDLRRKDIIVRFTNTQLEPIDSVKFKEILSLTRDVWETVNPVIKVAILRVTLGSHHLREKNKMISKMINAEHLQRVKNFTVDLDLTDQKSSKNQMHIVKVTTSHTKSIHKQYDALGKSDLLKKLIVIDSFKSLSSSPKKEQAFDFMTQQIGAYLGGELLEEVVNARQ